MIRSSIYVLYKAGAMSWNKYGTYDSKEEMIEDLINTYGVEDLKDYNENDLDSILKNWEFKYEII